MATSVQPCECGQVLHPNERHCWFHHVPEEPRRPYRLCFECGHMWTKTSLRRAYRRGLLSVQSWEHRNILFSDKSDFGGPSWVQMLWCALTIRVKNIHFCPLCIHDW